MVLPKEHQIICIFKMAVPYHFLMTMNFYFIDE